MEENRFEKPFIIGITGGSGSGKTSFIKALRTEFDESQLCIVSQDDYYRPREDQKTDEQGIKNFDIPYSIHLQEFHADILKLMKGQEVARIEYVFNNEKAKPKDLVFKPAPIIMLEGLFVFSDEQIRSLINLKLFIDAHENIKVIRRIRRDRVERNYPLEDVLYRYEKHVLPAYQKYIEPYRGSADIVINNHSDFQKGLEVVVGYINYRLDSH